MKKIFLFAAAAAMLTACSSDELASVESAQQNAGEAPVNFSVYTPRSVTRAGEAQVITTTELKTTGFGIMAYYTDDEKYDGENSTPNFMYNSKVTYNTTNSAWEYNPVMYWPNEFSEAYADNTDYVSFFSYAPYIDVTNETGVPVLDPITDYDAYAASLGYKYTVTEYADVTNRTTYQKYSGKTLTVAEFITEIATLSGDASITTNAKACAWLQTSGLKYLKSTLKTVTDLATYQTYIGASSVDEAKASLDEIWKKQVQGTNITQLPKNTTAGDPIVKYVVDTNPSTSVDLLWGVAATTPDTYYKPIVDAAATVTEGKPFVDLIKPKTSATDNLKFNMMHALAKLNVSIKYIADANTPSGTSETIDNEDTRIYVRSVKIGGFVMKGALNLNNSTASTPLWKGYDGKTALQFNTVTFNDGRKDGKEGIQSGAYPSEENQGLNLNIIENYSEGVWPTGKTDGVTSTAVNLFGNGGAKYWKPIFVIPTNEDIDIEIVYDVETKDNNLNSYLSDGKTKGISISNTIRKSSKDIFGSTTAMEPGKGYKINIILGMTSVKFEAAVTDWDTTTTAKDVDLPKN